MRATVEAAQPGQVMTAEYPGTPDNRWPGSVDIRAVRSTFPPGTALSFVEGAGASSAWPDSFRSGDTDTFAASFTAHCGRRYTHWWAGPSAAPWLDIELERVDYWPRPPTRSF